MSDRDPRVDPRVGDVVRKGDRERTILRTQSTSSGGVGEIQYEVRVDDRPGRKGGVCWITSWQDWCRGAEVVQRGEESR